MRTSFPRLAEAKYFSAIVAALVFLVALAAPSAADDGDWTEFVFDSSSDGYKVERERVFDLRSGRYSTPAHSQTQSGDYITSSGFNPFWVTLTTVNREKILFGNSAAGSIKVDETAERMSNCVPIHYGDSYVASFEDRNYTIRLVEGSYESPAGYARFLYKSGGVRGPEHEPRKASARDRRKSAPRLESSGDADYDEEGRIDEVTITVILPRPRNEDSPESHPFSFSLNTSYEGGFSSMNRMSLGIKEGSEETFTYGDVRPATYSVKIV